MNKRTYEYSIVCELITSKCLYDKQKCNWDFLEQGPDECQCWPAQMIQNEIHILFGKNINI
ncbi:hypothetical protein DERP_007699 [Dermatophagoides pteronyssinus]|uniref:Uncharacterized protein n=1 Tax=Dermatophagoides pteronyssinus TaxID=6956 RepID=A0ABQ8JL19_DERPT|nr:hypothetical protein DERP_007699 [Dermatophagoides pteronyssinus]